jgi:PAS domain S-box-containing protein
VVSITQSKQAMDHPPNPTDPQPGHPVPATPLPSRLEAPQYQLLTEQLPAITYIVELLPTPHTTYISPQVLPMLGFTPEEWLADSGFWIRQLHPADRETVLQEVHRHNQSGTAYSLEYRLLARDGRTVWIRNSATYQRDGAGPPTHLHGGMFDITHHRLAEEALRECDAKHRALVANLPDIIMHFDRDGRHLFVSDNVEPVAGLPAAAFLGKTHRELGFPAPLCDFWEKSIGQIIQTGQPLETEFAVDAVNEHRIFNWRLFPESDASGQVQSVLSIARDITAQKHAEQALGSSEAQNRALVSAIPDLVFVNRRDGEFLFFHAPDPARLAVAPDAILHRKVTDILPPPVAAQCLQAIAAALDSDTLQSFEYSLPMSGGTRWFEARVAPCTADSTLTIVRDITERKQAEETLEITQQSYLDLLNSMTEAIYVQDENGTFIDVNQGAEIMYRCAREDLIGKAPPDVAAPGLNDLDLIQQMSAEVARTGIPVHFRFWAVRKDGEIFPKEVGVTRGRYFGQNVLIAVARDISAAVQAEAEKERLQTQLAQARRLESIGRLAGGVAHDFNNMLQTILGNAELALGDLPPGSETRESVEEIRKAAERSANLTRQLLAFARRQTIAPRLLDLNEAIAGTLKMLQRLLGEGIQLAWHPDVHPFQVEMDPSQLDQILVNLCVNARDAMSGQGILAIETGTAALDAAACAKYEGVAPGEFVVLAVRDNGAGMDKDTLEHLFEPFYTTKDVGLGTGLGLATVYGIVRQNRGFIHVESAPGQGAAFEIHLPRHRGPSATAAPPPPARAPARGHETLLMIEDDPAILDLARRMLERLGYTLLTAQIPSEALNLVRTRHDPVHLLITDVVMPDMNGKELARQIQALRPGLKCLFISGHTADILAPQGILAPGVHFIQKPFSVSDLADKIRAVLDAP